MPIRTAVTVAPRPWQLISARSPRSRIALMYCIGKMDVTSPNGDETLTGSCRRSWLAPVSSSA